MQTWTLLSKAFPNMGVTNQENYAVPFSNKRRKEGVLGNISRSRFLYLGGSQ